MKPLLGVDLGDARTGLAISDELRFLAHPLETIASGSPAAVARRISEIVSAKNVATVVVGVPRHMNGEFGTGAQKAIEFAEKLRATVPCEVVTSDERLSTRAAQRALHESGRKTHQTRGVLDQVAAQIILQGYLDRLNA